MCVQHDRCIRKWLWPSDRGLCVSQCFHWWQVWPVSQGLLQLSLVQSLQLWPSRHPAQLLWCQWSLSVWPHWHLPLQGNSSVHTGKICVESIFYNKINILILHIHGVIPYLIILSRLMSTMRSAPTASQGLSVCNLQIQKAAQPATASAGPAGASKQRCCGSSCSYRTWRWRLSTITPPPSYIQIAMASCLCPMTSQSSVWTPGSTFITLSTGTSHLNFMEIR